MSNLNIRLVKLEAAMLSEIEPMRIARFIVDPVGLEPKGYICEGVEIIREQGESTTA